MAAYDILVIEWFNPGNLVGFAGLGYYDRQLKVTEFSAAGEIHIRHRGTKKYKLSPHGSFPAGDRKVIIEENLRLDSQLTSEGWRLANPNHAGNITNPGGELIYVRRSSVPNPMSIAERLATLKELVHKGNKDDRRTGELLYRLSQHYLVPLEEQTGEHVDPDGLIERLERLSKLHRQGDLSDAQFEQAKNAALGL